MSASKILDSLSNLSLSDDEKNKVINDVIEKCESVSKENPGNLCTKYATEYLKSEEGKSLSNEGKSLVFFFSVSCSATISCNAIIFLDLLGFYKCIKTGIENPDSKLGAYAAKVGDYKKYHSFFDKVIRDYHGAKTEDVHSTDWTTLKDASLNLKECGLDEVSMRIRVGRNLASFDLPASMDKINRIEFEKKMTTVFDTLKEKYGGVYHSLSPDWNEEENPFLISTEKYEELVSRHYMFKDMSSDSYLSSASISSDWPYGRGCWISDDESNIIWVGEEDQLRIMCMENGSDLLKLFKDLKDLLDSIEKVEGIEFAKDENYGYITSCPSNLGTAMRASVHIKIPQLTADGSISAVGHLCQPLGLSVRGTGGEHTPVVDGILDISPSSRLFVSESQILSSLYRGIQSIVAIDNHISNLLNMKAEVRNDNEQNQDKAPISFVLVENDKTVERDDDEKKKSQQAVRDMKKKMKLMKKSSLMGKSAKCLQLSPGPVLQLTNA